MAASNLLFFVSFSFLFAWIKLMLRAALRTYPSMNIFMFGWRTNDFAHSYRNGCGWWRKFSWWQLSPWSSFCRSVSASPNRKLKRYGLAKMCYFCVMFGFWSEFWQKSLNDLVFAQKHVVLLRSLQKPDCRAQKRLTLTEGLSEFL